MPRFMWNCSGLLVQNFKTERWLRRNAYNSQVSGAIVITSLSGGDNDILQQCPLQKHLVKDFDIFHYNRAVAIID